MATEKLISANSLRNAFRKRMVERFDKDLCANEENCKACYPGCFWWSAIEKEPAVDAVEVVHGRWMEFNSFMSCSECDTDWYYGDNDCDRFDYCPNCGAKMDGDGNV